MIGAVRGFDVAVSEPRFCLTWGKTDAPSSYENTRISVAVENLGVFPKPQLEYVVWKPEVDDYWNDLI